MCKKEIAQTRNAAAFSFALKILTSSQTDPDHRGKCRIACISLASFVHGSGTDA